MFAIVEIAGQQFKVERDQKLYVHRLDAKEGSKVSFDNVLLTDDGKKVNVGTPNVIGAAVKAKVLAHLKGDKVKVFKKKRRKGYQKLNGHRQFFSHIQIDEISLDGKPSAKKETAKTEVKSKPAEKKAAMKTSPKTSVKKEETKKPAEKKEEAKKPAAKKPGVKKETAKADNLTKIEGVGPKIASILKDAGIDTFKKLSTAKAEKVSEILVEAGGNAYNRFDTTTWPDQAKLAADGKWDELKTWQDELKGGKE